MFKYVYDKKKGCYVAEGLEGSGYQMGYARIKGSQAKLGEQDIEYVQALVVREGRKYKGRIEFVNGVPIDKGVDWAAKDRKSWKLSQRTHQSSNGGGLDIVAVSTYQMGTEGTMACADHDITTSYHMHGFKFDNSLNIFQDYKGKVKLGREVFSFKNFNDLAPSQKNQIIEIANILFLSEKARKSQFGIEFDFVTERLQSQLDELARLLDELKISDEQINALTSLKSGGLNDVSKKEALLILYNLFVDYIEEGTDPKLIEAGELLELVGSFNVDGEGKLIDKDKYTEDEAKLAKLMEEDVLKRILGYAPLMMLMMRMVSLERNVNGEVIVKPALYENKVLVSLTQNRWIKAISTTDKKGQYQNPKSLKRFDWLRSFMVAIFEFGYISQYSLQSGEVDVSHVIDEDKMDLYNEMMSEQHYIPGNKDAFNNFFGGICQAWINKFYQTQEFDSLRSKRIVSSAENLLKEAYDQVKRMLTKEIAKKPAVRDSVLSMITSKTDIDFSSLSTSEMYKYVRAIVDLYLDFEFGVISEAVWNEPYGGDDFSRRFLTMVFRAAMELRGEAFIGKDRTFRPVGENVEDVFWAKDGFDGGANTNFAEILESYGKFHDILLYIRSNIDYGLDRKFEKAANRMINRILEKNGEKYEALVARQEHLVKSYFDSKESAGKGSIRIEIRKNHYNGFQKNSNPKVHIGCPLATDVQRLYKDEGWRI